MINKSSNTFLNLGVTIGTCIFMFPIGLILLWRFKIFNQSSRLIVSILGLLCIKHILVLYMMVYGRLLYPEASMVLAHYCFGDGSALQLPSEYIRTSPIVIKHLKQMKTGECKRITAKQHEDYRLTYALNPFTMTKMQNFVLIEQKIEFDKSGHTYTYIGPFRIPDNVVHVFNCTPFVAKCKFYY